MKVEPEHISDPRETKAARDVRAIYAARQVPPRVSADTEWHARHRQAPDPDPTPAEAALRDLNARNARSTARHIPHVTNIYLAESFTERLRLLRTPLEVTGEGGAHLHRFRLLDKLMGRLRIARHEDGR